jgi:folate-binding protein YgfZ
MPAPSTRVVAAAAPGYTATMTLSEKLAAAREAVAVGPVEAPGVLRVTGKDRQDFLHRMCTQKVNGVAPGEAVHAAFLTAKGRVLAEGMVLVRAEDVLLVVHPRTAEPLRVHLVKYVIMDEVEVEDASAGWRLVAVLGPGAADRAGRRGPSALAFADPRRGAPAQDLLAPPEEAEALRARLAAAGATPLEEGDLEVLRILGGAARFGVDVDEERLPMEAGLIATAVSFDKGCYLGQEVVLRGTFRGQIQRGLVQLALPPEAVPGAPLSAGGKEVGVVTSAAETPEGRVGLGYLRRMHWNVGERLATTGGEAVVRRVLVQEREKTAQV